MYMFFVIQLFTYYFLLSFLVLKDHEDTHWSFQFTLYILKVCLVLLVLAHSPSLSFAILFSFREAIRDLCSRCRLHTFQRCKEPNPNENRTEL